MSSQEIHSLAHGMLAAVRIFEEKTAEAVNEWVALQTLHNKLTAKEADRDFRFDDLTDDDTGIIFRSEDWEETWSYGGYENHYGRSTVIPFAFFDDPQPYRDEAARAVELRGELKTLQTKREKAALVARLEAQLAKAKQEG